MAGNAFDLKRLRTLADIVGIVMWFTAGADIG